MAMVSTSHQQYLCPDFLNPSPPATMESSPLALLAQTCNSIGLPDGAGTVTVNGTSKTTKNDNSKSSESNRAKDETLSKSGSKKTTTSAADSSSDSSSTSGTATRSSPASKDASGTRSPESGRKSENKSRNAGQNGVTSCEGKSSDQGSNEAKADSAVTVSSAASTSAPISASTSGLLMSKCPTTSNPLTSFPTTAFPPGLLPPYFPNSTPAAAFPYGTSAHMPSLAFATGSCFPPFPSSLQAASNPWLPPPLPGFAPKCTDPFCKTCPAIAGAATAIRGPCGAALGCPCVQCGGGHSTSDLPLWLSSYSSLLGQTVGLHGASASMGTGPASIYAAAAAAAAAAQQANSMTSTSTSTSSTLGAANQPQQHTCNWMMGNEFCGKRFSTSEELLQHLRSHTSQDSATAAANSTATSVVSTGGLSGFLPTTGRLSPRLTYLNSLNSLRYHPYAKMSPATANAAAAAALASLPFPPPTMNPTATAFNPLSAFCGALTSQRLPATLPHP